MGDYIKSLSYGNRLNKLDVKNKKRSLIIIFNGHFFNDLFFCIDSKKYYNMIGSCVKTGGDLQTPEKEVTSLRIETITETIFMFIGIIMFVKELIDWYIDYRIDKKISDNNKKNHRYSRKDKR